MSTNFSHDHAYLNLMQRILDEGTRKEGRNGATIDLFGAQLRFDLRKGFPLLTTKKVFYRGIFEELLWFLRGETNIRSLQERKVHIWNDWADENGELGPVYGKQWRAFGGIVARNPNPEVAQTPAGGRGGVDQIAKLIEALRKNPSSRRHIVTAWDPREVDQMALPPCHCLFQFDVTDGRLSCQLYQRSADYFLGVPFNIASYAALTHLIAFEVGLEVGDFVHTFGSVHLYENHLKQAEVQLRRELRPSPRLTIEASGLISATRGRGALMEADASIFKVHDYNPHPAIKAEVSV